jgi:hypothetical protein
VLTRALNILRIPVTFKLRHYRFLLTFLFLSTITYSRAIAELGRTPKICKIPVSLALGAWRENDKRLENQEASNPMRQIAELTARADAISIRTMVWTQFEQVAREQERSLPPLSDDLVLAETDLDSLCFAIIVARLEDALGYDPFSLADDMIFPVTLRDFVNLYETYANGTG